MVLFKGLKRLKNIKANKNSQPSGIYPIKSATELLSSKNNQQFLQTINSLIKPRRDFDYFYFPVIEKFAEFVQTLPENKRGFFDHEVEFLTQGLERVSRTLSLCLAYFFPEKNDFSNISKHDALWIYATFTAALFLDIGKIAVKYTIMLYHDKAYPLKKWNPYVGPMSNLGSYYKFDYIKENFNDLRCLVTPMLARQILDSDAKSSENKGFNWIASDPEALEVWFALLTGEEKRIPMTSFMSVIPRAEIEIIENYRKENKISLTDPAGEAFLQWLRKEIKAGNIVINGKDAKIRVLEKEIILSTALFQQFVNVNSSYKHPEIIEKQFINIAKLYQISIGELDQRYRAYGGISGLSDSAKRYRAIGGLASLQETAKLATERFLTGGIGLLSLITSQALRKEVSSSPNTLIKPLISPKLTT